jgi:hypothetical protein
MKIPMTRVQAVAIALLGAWIGWTLFVWFMAGRSFATVERALEKPHPAFEQTTRPLAPEQTRGALRYLASEINRSMFRAYGWGQVLLGAAVFLLLWRLEPADKFSVILAGVMLALVLILALVVTPLLISVGRGLDFVPREPPPPGLRRFWMLHGAFTALDGAKLVAALVLTIRWVVRG